MGHRLDASEQGGEQMPMPVRCDAQKGAGRRCCRKHSGVPRNSASLLENLHKKSYGAKGEGEQREKRPELVRQHFVLSARDLCFLLDLLLL